MVKREDLRPGDGDPDPDKAGNKVEEDLDISNDAQENDKMDAKDSDYEEEADEDSDINDESESNDDDADFTPAGATKRITRGRKRKEKLKYKKGGKKMKKTIQDSEEEDSRSASEEHLRRSKRNTNKRRNKVSSDEAEQGSSDTDDNTDQDSDDNVSSKTRGRANKRQKRTPTLRIKFNRRTRKQIVSSSDDDQADSDQEFEDILMEAESTMLENEGHIKAAGKKSKRKAMDYSLSDAEHDEYCYICHQGGEIILCDTCSKVYHLCCLEPELDRAPEGKWSCPHCEEHGLTKDEVDDGYNVYCKSCKDGGELICCDSCPDVYHLDCINPPLDLVPAGDWMCPRCACEPLPGKVQMVLTWRWKEFANHDIEEKETTKKRRRRKSVKNGLRELFVKFKGKSYWQCSWVQEIQLEVYWPQGYRMYMSKNDMVDEPLNIEEEELIGEGEISPQLYQKFYRFGVRPAWIQPDRVINTRVVEDGDIQYLVKWQDLAYDQCTWENGDSDIPELSDRIQDYEDLRFVHLGQTTSKERRGKSCKETRVRKYQPFPDKAVSKLDVKYDDNDMIKWLPPNLALHNYQLEGLSWARHSWKNKTDIILADEMGLGKTIQAITFIYSLYKEGHCQGPFLIAVPLSTLINWEREFALWAPEFYVVSYAGYKENRQVIRENELSFEDTAVRKTGRVSKLRSSTYKFNVLLTSYEMINTDSALLSSVDWEIIVVDEAHRLKNSQSLFFRTLSSYTINYKMLLTGTPLQNNLEELFYLLNFLTPRKFNNLEIFQSTFQDIGKEDQVRKLHELLGPHILRRMKSDVLKAMPSKSEFIVQTSMSALQKKVYKDVLTRNYDALTAKGGGKVSLMNIMMQLRKCTNHPFLLPGPAEQAQITPAGLFECKDLTNASGKLALLEKMLAKLKEQGHRVLIFSQMTKMLDILEEFLFGIGIKFERIDGGITGTLRQEAIDRFNQPGAQQLCFLLSTRAGGLGINLATADTVIIYDSDWNPHNDIQALSRAHRIGQKNKVMIYRFVTRNTVEERVVEVAKKKMMLTHLVVQPGMQQSGNQTNNKMLTKKEIEDILKFGTEELFKEDGSVVNEIVYDDATVEALLDRSKQGEEENENWANQYLSSFKVATYQTKVLEEETKLTEVNSSAPTYWKNLLKNEHEVKEETCNMGKGMRVRQRVKYYDNCNDSDNDDPKSKETNNKHVADDPATNRATDINGDVNSDDGLWEGHESDISSEDYSSDEELDETKADDKEESKAILDDKEKDKLLACELIKANKPALNKNNTNEQKIVKSRDNLKTKKRTTPKFFDDKKNKNVEVSSLEQANNVNDRIIGNTMTNDDLDLINDISNDILDNNLNVGLLEIDNDTDMKAASKQSNYSDSSNDVRAASKQSYSYDSDDDVRAAFKQSYSYDSDDDVRAASKQSYSYDSDDYVRAASKQSYSYDSDDDVRAASKQSYSYDSDDDWRAALKQSYSYDSNDDIIAASKQSYSSDSNDDVRPTSKQSFSSDSNDKKERCKERHILDPTLGISEERVVKSLNNDRNLNDEKNIKAKVINREHHKLAKADQKTNISNTKMSVKKTDATVGNQPLVDPTNNLSRAHKKQLGIQDAFARANKLNKSTTDYTRKKLITEPKLQKIDVNNEASCIQDENSPLIQNSKPVGKAVKRTQLNVDGSSSRGPTVRNINQLDPNNKPKNIFAGVQAKKKNA